MGVRLWFGAGAVAGIVLLIFVVSMRFTTLESPSRSSPPVMEDDTGRKSELSQNKLWSSIATSMSFGPLWRDLDEILVVRPVGTPALRAVEDYISKAMEKSGWTVTHDRFSGSTPLGTKDFSNIISSRNPDVKKNRVVFAAHYDSKYFPDPNNFVGATDSAVPCAILLDLGRIISRLAPELAVDIVFFDGEEAIRDWTATDSLYGARHLAERWEQEGRLPSIRHFVLLDLMGAPNSRFGSHYANTQGRFQQLVQIEDVLRRENTLKSRAPMFLKQPFNMGIEDDHIPFLRRGVPIVHVIATPFPPVWHTDGDNRANLSTEAVEDLAAIFRVFAVMQGSFRSLVSMYADAATA